MNDPREASPASDAPSDEMDSLSMRDKSLIKRSVSKHHNNNFTAGYVPVHEQHLQRTGLRGRKTFAFWTLVGLLFVLAVGNLILTMTILGVLRLGQGMQSLELVPESEAIKLFGSTDLNDVYKRDGRLEGYADYPIDITSHNGSIVVKLSPKNGRAVDKLSMTANGTMLHRISSFEVRDGDSAVFTTDSPEFNIVRRLSNVNARAVRTGRLVSPVGAKLEVEGRNVNLKGAEGTWIEGGAILLGADSDVYLKSINGSIVLSGQTGTYLDVKKLPIYVPKHGERPSMQYKLCVCMPQGKLFKIPVAKDSGKVYCDHINLAQFNPCVANK